MKTVSGIFSIFNSCYKSGVKDAEYVSDPDMCREFASTVREPGVYGRVIHNYTMSKHEWRCHIPTINPYCSIHKEGIRYLFTLENYTTYFACVLPVAQEFYIQGLDDYNVNPTIHNFSMFDNNKSQRWTRKGIIPRHKKLMLFDMQQLCFLRSINDENYKENKDALKRNRYVYFSQAVWAAMQTKHLILDA